MLFQRGYLSGGFLWGFFLSFFLIFSVIKRNLGRISVLRLNKNVFKWCVFFSSIVFPMSRCYLKFHFIIARML